MISFVLVDLDGEKRDPLCNPYWIQDIELPFETKDVLTSSETLFWQKLIEKYLTPIEANEAREVPIIRFAIRFNN